MEISQPLVSMVIPSYNHARYVRTCINSIISQDYRNIELIIIDDGSTDESTRCIEELVPACRERFVRFEFRSRPNKGLSATVDEGLKWARGKYFASLCSDDALLPGKTSTLVSQIDGEPRVGAVFSGCELIDAKDALIRTLRPSLAYVGFDDLLLRKKYLVVCSSQLIRVDAAMEVGGYPPNYYIEDWYMWLKLTERKYSLKIVPDVLVQYRQHEVNISKNALKMYESRKQILANFSQYPAAIRGLAVVNLMAAIDFSSSSKRDSLRYLVEALKLTPMAVFSHLFVGAAARLMAPNFVLRSLRSAKAGYQRWNSS